MTKKQLNDLGFDITGLNRVWHGQTETEFRVENLKKIRPTEFIVRFFNVAFDYGKIYGANTKLSEIKKALNIEP
jgi:hypothetical protein